MAAWQAIGVWIFCATALTGIVARPWRIPEWVWTIAAAIGVVTLGAVPLEAAAATVANGADVYAFLIGILLLAEIGRRERVFDAFAAWLGAFGACAAGAVAVTFLALRLATNASLGDPLHGRPMAAPPEARFGAIVLGIAGLLLVVAALVGADIGYAALACGAGAFALTYSRDRGARTIVRHLSWQIVPLVAGLFVLVAALERVGALAALRQALVASDRIGPPAAALAVSAAVTIAANVAKNFPCRSQPEPCSRTPTSRTPSRAPRSSPSILGRTSR